MPSCSFWGISKGRPLGGGGGKSPHVVFAYFTVMTVVAVSVSL